MPEVIGTLLNGRYRLEAVIGQGGMGVVYRAHDILLDRPVAVKVLSATELGAEGRTRLLREARAAAGLNHPNIVTVHDVGEVDASSPQGPMPFIVMELVEGPSLHERRPGSLEETVSIARQVSAALEHAHARAIVHRDLKPENVLLTPDPREGAGVTAKLVDFGLARSVASRTTGEGVIAGTVFYLAPELALGQPYDGRADLYALGVMLYELTTGRLPFIADDPLAVISQHLHAPVVSPRARNPDVPVALDALVVQLLSKDPAARPASAAEVRRRLAAPGVMDREAAPARELTLLERIERGRLVGRQRELQEARAVWNRAAAGQGQVLFVTGEPGIGKTRLVRELATQVEVGGAQVVVGECYAEGGVPYAPFAQVVRRALSSDASLDLPDYVLADLLTLAPALRPAHPGIAPNPPLDPQAEQYRLYENVVALFAVLGQGRPLLLVVEDVHWADSGTLGLLRHLARRTRRQPLLIVATYREVELDYSRPFQEVLLDLNRERLVTRLKLTRLSREDTRDLLEALFAEEITPALLEGIYRETEGNPFFVEEVCKALIESGQLRFVDGRWHRPSVAELGIPQSVRVAIQSRVGRLPEAVQEALRLAAVVGREFDFDSLGEAGRRAPVPSPLQDEEALVEALEQAERAQLVVEIGREGGGTFSFAHALIHTTLLEGVSGLRRRRLHRQVLAALEALRPDDLEAQARHALEAGALDQGLALSLRVAARARRVAAFDEALLHYQRAREIAEMQAATDRLAAIHEAIGDLQNRRDVAAAVDAYQQALSLTDTPQRRAALTAKIGGTYASVGDERGLVYLQRAVPDLDPQSQANERAQAVAAIGRFHHYHGQHRRALTYLEQAREAAEPLEDPFTLTVIYGYLAGAYQHLARFEQSMAWARRNMDLGQRLGYPPAVAIGYEFLAEDSVMMGRWEDGLSFAAEDRRIGEETGVLAAVAWAAYSAGLARHGLGDLRGAEQTARQGLDLAETIGDGRLVVLMSALLALVQTDLGQMETAQQTATQAAERGRQMGQVLMLCMGLDALAHWHMQSGDPHAALACLEEAMDVAAPTDSRSVRLFVGPRHAEVQLALGDLVHATEIAQQTSHVARQADAQHYLAVTRRVQGQILAAQARWEEAASEFDASLALLEELGSRLELGRALFHQGEMLARHGEEQAARASLAHAHEILDACHAPVDIGRARTALQALEAGA